MKKSILVLPALLSLFLLVSCSVSPKGAASPKELIIAAKDANNDTKALKSCYYWSTPEEEANIDAVLALKDMKPEVDAFFEEGKKKFGSKFSEALGMGTFVLVMSTSPMPYDKLENGQYTETGDTAFVTATIPDGASSYTTKSMMIKKDGKWYFPAPSTNGPKTPAEITALMKSFVEEAKKALETSDSPEKFAETINTFMSTKMN